VSTQPKPSTFLPFMAMASNRELCARTLAQSKLPVENRISPGHFDPTNTKIKVMNMKVNKRLDFPVMALPGVGQMPWPGEDEKEAARVLYMAAALATQRLLMRGGASDYIADTFGNFFVRNIEGIT
jgi:hypothetical protein